MRSEPSPHTKSASDCSTRRNETGASRKALPSARRPSMPVPMPAPMLVFVMCSPVARRRSDARVGTRVAGARTGVRLAVAGELLVAEAGELGGGAAPPRGERVLGLVVERVLHCRLLVTVTCGWVGHEPLRGAPDGLGRGDDVAVA